MNEKRFRVRFEQEDGGGEIVNEKGVELTAREVVDKLNEQQSTISALKKENKKLREGWKKEYLEEREEKQRVRKTKLRPKGYTDDEFEKIFEIRYSKGIVRR